MRCRLGAVCRYLIAIDLQSPKSKVKFILSSDFLSTATDLANWQFINNSDVDRIEIVILVVWITSPDLCCIPFVLSYWSYPYLWGLRIVRIHVLSIIFFFFLFMSSLLRIRYSLLIELIFIKSKSNSANNTQQVNLHPP